MLKAMLRLLSPIACGAIGLALITLPVRSREPVRIVAIPSAQTQPSGAPTQPNTLPAVSTSQIPLSTASEESPGPTVILDPAHGGADFGARGPTGLAESDVVLDFARAARIALEAQRLRVLLTREGNQDPTFDNRSAMVNGIRNAIFISLHVSSGGPVGTIRTYYYAFPSDATPVAPENPASAGLNQAQPASPPQRGPAQSSVAQASTSQLSSHSSLTEWDHAQRSSVDSSRHLAMLMQTELLPRFMGSPAMAIAAPVRQLRTIAAPAIAIELSSINVADSKRLEEMAQPLAEAISRAVTAFRYPPNASSAPASNPASNGAR